MPKDKQQVAQDVADIVSNVEIKTNRKGVMDAIEKALIDKSYLEGKDPTDPFWEAVMNGYQAIMSSEYNPKEILDLTTDILIASSTGETEWIKQDYENFKKELVGVEFPAAPIPVEEDGEDEEEDSMVD